MGTTDRGIYEFEGPIAAIPWEALHKPLDIHTTQYNKIMNRSQIVKEFDIKAEV